MIDVDDPGVAQAIAPIKSTKAGRMNMIDGVCKIRAAQGCMTVLHPRTPDPGSEP